MTACPPGIELPPAGDREETIAAVSSPPGRSPRGLVRLSGPDVRPILGELLDAPLSAVRTLAPVRLHLPGHPPLPALVAFFAGPASYTGQDVAELQVPGHPALLDRVLRGIIDRGARLAGPGEFTFRAFVAGKLDLTQAEGIAATITASSESQLRAAGLLREGQLGRLAAAATDQLGDALALVEAGIDFTDEEDVVPIGPGALDERLAKLEEQLAGLVRRSRSWGAIEALPRVVLAGPPSAGKSTLFNALLGRRRAVISEVPGTTRDVLAEPLALEVAGEPVEVLLVDMAGLDRTDAALDEQIQAAARRAIDEADLLLAVGDPEHDPRELAESLSRTAPAVAVLTQADRLTGPPPDGVILVSGLTGEGLSGLRDRLAREVGERGVSVAGDLLALQPRHEHALHRTLEALSKARELLAPQRDSRDMTGVELVAGSLREALDELASLGGRLTPDEVIGRVFARFCVGK
ncbi:MAG: tRNA modification GTPase [Phycisphaeraceae bacterium]